VFSRARPAVPGARPAVPGARPAVPGARPAVPGARPAGHSTRAPGPPLGRGAIPRAIAMDARTRGHRLQVMARRSARESTRQQGVDTARSLGLASVDLFGRPGARVPCLRSPALAILLHGTIPNRAEPPPRPSSRRVDAPARWHDRASDIRTSARRRGHRRNSTAVANTMSSSKRRETSRSEGQPCGAMPLSDRSPAEAGARQGRKEPR
jgi:hypothetical protein